MHVCLEHTYTKPNIHTWNQTYIHSKAQTYIHNTKHTDTVSWHRWKISKHSGAQKMTTLSRKRGLRFFGLALLLTFINKSFEWNPKEGPKTTNVSQKTRPLYFSLEFQWPRYQPMEALDWRSCSKLCVLSIKLRLRLRKNFSWDSISINKSLLLKLFGQKHVRCARFWARNVTYLIFLVYFERVKAAVSNINIATSGQSTRK